MPRRSNSERDVEEIKQTILQFLNENPGPHYPLDLAENLGFEPELVFEAIERLLTEEPEEVEADEKAESK